MRSSPCERYLRICEKGGDERACPHRFLRAANDNRYGFNPPLTLAPESTPPSFSYERSPAIKFGSALSMLGLVAVAAHVELKVIGSILIQALDGLLGDAPSILW